MSIPSSFGSMWIGSKSSIGDLLLSGDTVAQSDKEKANDFFASVFTSEDTSSLPDFHVDSTLPILSSVFIAPDDVYVKLCNFFPNKSSGLALITGQLRYLKTWQSNCVHPLQSYSLSQS